MNVNIYTQYNLYTPNNHVQPHIVKLVQFAQDLHYIRVLLFAHCTSQCKK